MKLSFSVYVSSLVIASVAAAAVPLGFPEDDPLLTFSIPDDWETKSKNGSLFVLSPDGGGVIVELMPMDAAADEHKEALKEAAATVDGFKNLKLTNSEPVESNGLTMTMLGGAGEDDNGEAHINMAVIKHPDAGNHILFSLIASKATAEKYGPACGEMFGSLRAAEAVPDAEEKPAVAAGGFTFTYPDAKKPDFAIDFPAGWQSEKLEQGVYVTSPDELVAVNVLMIDAKEVEEAQENMKKSLGGRFKEVVWNGGNDPKVNKDPDLGLTATFNAAVASDGEGTEQYAINLVSYVRKDGDKALILICQNPLAAVKKHGDAMESMLKSIKVR